MVRDARLVRARTAEEGPLVDHELAQATGLGVCGTEPPARAAADEDHVEAVSLVTMDILQRL